MDALCDHLEAVTLGHIRFLLCNYPFRCGKTSIASICWPAWTWTRRANSFTSGSAVRFFCGGYNHDLALQSSNKTRRLIMSPWYQERWADRFTLLADQNTKTQFDNDKGGSRLASSVRGTLLGVGGDVIDIDDPHNTEEAESDAERETAIQWWKEVRSTRLNDPQRTAIVLTMQRLHEQDLSGVIMEEDDADEWVKLVIPMHHDLRRHCVTVLKWDDEGEPAKVWEDPRSEDGELMWPDRFPESVLAQMTKTLGPYMASGRLEQMPTPAGGGIIKSDMWQLWPSDEYPQCELVLASLDTAMTEKEENDASALTIWGVFRDGAGYPKAVLMNAWEGRLEMHDLVILVGMLCSVDGRDEDEIDAATVLFNKGATQVDCIARMPVDKLLVENKANGISVAHELRRLFGNMGNFAVELVDPKQWGDKVARLTALEPMFADEMIYAPDRQFADRVINNVALAPKTTKWDTPDSVSMALRYLRQTGALLNRQEQSRETLEESLHRGRMVPLY